MAFVVLPILLFFMSGRGGGKDAGAGKRKLGALELMFSSQFTKRQCEDAAAAAAAAASTQPPGEPRA